MKLSQKLKIFVSRVEIAIAVVLFFFMLYACGKYIDIKINGKTSSLPPIPEYQKQILLKTGAAENKVYIDNMIEPLFIGFKDGDTAICATFDKEARASLKNIVTPMLYSLFSGTSEKIDFDDENKKKQFIKQLCEKEKYIFVSYYDDIPAGIFLPCLSSDYEISQKSMYFDVQSVFILEDENGRIYAVALSKDGNANKLIPEENILFGKISTQEYDISDGYSYFTFDDQEGIHPVFVSSFITNKYQIKTISEKFGKDESAFWIQDLFDIFSVNSNFVKSYSSKNDSEMIYVDDENELFVNDEGYVEYKANSSGVSLENYLDYSVGVTGEYSFTDKIFAIKNLVNLLNFDKSDHRYCVVGIDYEEKEDKLKIYLKSFINGVSVSSYDYDAAFEIKGNYLVSARLYLYKCTMLDEYSVCLNQSYVNELFDESQQTHGTELLYYPLLEREEMQGKYFVSWARLSQEE